MFHFIEVIGQSSHDYSQAVKNAVDELIELSYDVHFFNVIEQRGAVRDNKIEYQVVLKVAVKQNGKKVNNDKKNNRNVNEYVCEWCGTQLFKNDNYEVHKNSNTIVCNNCGRISSIKVSSNKIVLK